MAQVKEKFRTQRMGEKVQILTVLLYRVDQLE